MDEAEKGLTGSPRIALFDVENAPSLGYFWGKLWETDIVGVTSPWYMLCYSWKWLDSPTIYTKALPDYPTYKKDKEDDTALIADLHRLFDEADILIAHNAPFDTRKAAARFIKHGLKPPSPCKIIDTLRECRKIALLDSNKLNDVAQYLGVGKKLPHTGFDLWRRVMRGDSDAWDLMVRYNRRDVALLEGVYTRLRPYMTNHPPLNAFTGEIRCPACQSSRLNRRGFAVSRSRRYQRWQCAGCGHWHQGDLVREPADGSTKKKSKPMPPYQRVAPLKPKKGRNEANRSAKYRRGR